MKLSSLLEGFKTRADQVRGVALTEFAIAIVPVLLLVGSVTDYGSYIHFCNEVLEASRAAARAAAVASMKSPGDSASGTQLNFDSTAPTNPIDVAAWTAAWSHLKDSNIANPQVHPSDTTDWHIKISEVSSNTLNGQNLIGVAAQGSSPLRYLRVDLSYVQSNGKMWECLFCFAGPLASGLPVQEHTVFPYQTVASAGNNGGKNGGAGG